LLRTPPCSWMWWACPEAGGDRFVPEAARQLEHSSDHGQTAYNSQCSCAAMILRPHRSHPVLWGVQGVVQVVVGWVVIQAAAPPVRPPVKARIRVLTPSYHGQGVVWVTKYQDLQHMLNRCVPAHMDTIQGAACPMWCVGCAGKPYRSRRSTPPDPVKKQCLKRLWRLKCCPQHP
jgi:hypothetical protein